MYSSGTERYTNKHIPRVDNPNMRDQKVLYNFDKTRLTWCCLCLQGRALRSGRYNVIVM